MCSIGLLLTIGGLLFKLSAVPFHFWAPDVYQGAPTDAVAFFTVAPKTAAIGFLAMFLVQIHWIDHPLLVKMILISAVASIVLGNLAALWQKNVKRMLAYSSIANAGYILLALLSVQGEEISIIVYYLFVYLCANFTIFFVVKWLERELKQEITFSQFDGLGYKSLWLGIFVTLSMISLAGLPPLAGFTAKLLIFGGVWSFYQVTQELYILIIMLIAVVNTVIGLVYYIRIPYALYFKKSSRNIGALSISGYVFIFMLSIQLLILFFTPNIYHFFE